MSAKKPWLIAGGVAVFVALFLATVLARGTSGPGVSVSTAPVRREKLAARVRATAEIGSARSVDISSKVLGEVVELPVREGTDVRAGALLAQIERRQYEAAVASARAALAQAEVAQRRLVLQRDNARRLLERQRSLGQGGFASAQELEQAEVTLSTAQVELEAQGHAIAQARSTLQRTQDDLERTTIRAPMDGRVIRLDVEKGETVVPGTMNLAGSVLMVVADVSETTAEASVNEADVVNLAIGQTAEVTVDALGGQKLAGTVKEIATSGRKDATGVVRFRVQVQLDDPPSALRPAMTAKVTILTRTVDDALVVPIQAVVKRRLGPNGKELDPDADAKTYKATSEVDVVYRLVDGKASLVAVKTAIADELRVQVTQGLAEGDLVVTGPYRTLRELRAGHPAHVESKAEAKKEGS